MKSTIILLSIFAITFGKIVPALQEDETIEVETAQNFNNYYSNLMNLSPGNREMLGITMNRDFPEYPSDPMQVQYPSMDFMSYPGSMGGMNYPNMGVNYPNMGMNYPNIMMPSFDSYPGYPGQYQGIAKTNACGCSSSCGMPCLWWSCTPCIPCPICPEEITTLPPTTLATLPTLSTAPQELETSTLPPSNSCPCIRVCPPCLPWFPCNPCSCPCQTPPDNILPTESTTTTQPTTTTTKLTTISQEITQTPPNNCIPCRPCSPCGPIWWIPCSPCNCNNGCQTSPPAIPTVAPMKNPPRNNASNTNRNNCQCVCAPCPPWQDCPPCPKTCPCY